jgi:hypothetical protein
VGGSRSCGHCCDIVGSLRLFEKLRLLKSPIDPESIHVHITDDCFPLNFSCDTSMTIKLLVIKYCLETNALLLCSEKGGVVISSLHCHSCFNLCTAFFFAL